MFYLKYQYALCIIILLSIFYSIYSTGILIDGHAIVYVECFDWICVDIVDIMDLYRLFSETRITGVCNP